LIYLNRNVSCLKIACMQYTQMFYLNSAMSCMEFFTLNVFLETGLKMKRLSFVISMIAQTNDFDNYCVINLY
jgi:hypothetical protein